jgi:hypothetical protein
MRACVSYTCGIHASRREGSKKGGRKGGWERGTNQVGKCTGNRGRRPHRLVRSTPFPPPGWIIQQDTC